MIYVRQNTRTTNETVHVIPEEHILHLYTVEKPY